eukprot:CAMPEP_0179300464 /NCGR_PEP_ID=MMETSP0797-20121207/47046_1 /TAXON_ID=47934 /ORGANISM="Dinophysis acuminata, Strain DAEP01" /LENGTH=41 /DNA_ID= /DNA_START= /DNA_END= /DNA_ORIENTATION=
MGHGLIGELAGSQNETRGCRRGGGEGYLTALGTRRKNRVNR